MRPKLLAPWPLVLLAPWAPCADLETRTHEIPGATVATDADEHHCNEWPSAGELRPPDPSGPISFSEDSEEPWIYSGAPPAAMALAGAIREHIAPETWEREGASLEPDGKGLLVTAEPEVHERIRSFLEAIRNDSGFQVDIALVPNDALPEGAVAGSDLSAAVFAEAVEKGGDLSARVTLACRNAETVRSFAGSRRAALSDEGTAQAGYAPVTHPEIEQMPMGITVEAQALRIPGDRGVRVRFHVTRLRPAGGSRIVKTPFSTITLEPLGEESAEGIVIAPPERTAVAATLRLAGLDGPRDFSVLLRARTDQPVSGPPPTVTQAGPEIHDAAFLVDGGIKPAVLRFDLLEEILRTNVIDAASLHGLTVSTLEPHIIVSGPADGRRAVRDWLSARIERRARRAHVTVYLLEGPPAAIIDAVRGADGAGLKDGWREAAETKGARATAAGTMSFQEGGWCELRSLVATPFVKDVSAISGGAFGPNAFMPSVWLESLCTGLQARASLAQITHDWLELELDLVVTRASPGSSAEILAPADIGEVQSRPQRAEPGTTYPQRSWLWLPYDVDLPRLEVMDWEGSVAIPSGKPTLLRAGQVEGGLAWLIAVEGRIEGGTGARSEGGGLEREMQVFDTGFLRRGQDLAWRSAPGRPVLDTRGMPWNAELGLGPPPLPRPSIASALDKLLAEEEKQATRTTDENRRFVVVGPSTVQEKAHRLIEEIERDRAWTCRVDAAIVPCSVLDAAAPGWSAPGASPWLDGGALERALDAAGEAASFLSNVLPPGLLLSLEPAAWARVLPEHEVNMENFPILNPVVEWDTFGAYTKLRTAPETAPSLGPLEATVGRSRTTGKPERRRLPAGDVDLRSFRKERVLGTHLSMPGRTLVAGAWIRPGASGGTEPFAALIRVDAGTGELPRPLPAMDPEEEEDIEPPPPPPRPDPPRAAVLDVWLLSVSAAEAEGLSRGIDPARLDAMERAGGERLRLAGSLGAKLELTAVSGRSYITGQKLLSGSRAPELITVSDFEVDSIGEGVSLDARVASAPGGLAQISIRGERNGPPRVDRKTRLKAEPLPRGDASGKPLAGPPEDVWVEIDLPEVEEDRWQNDLAIPTGWPVLLRAVPAAEGKTRVIIVRVDIHEP